MVHSVERSVTFIQFRKNRSYHSGIKRSPYKALFGSHPKIGLDVLSSPEVVKTLRTEEDLQHVLGSMQTNEDDTMLTTWRTCLAKKSRCEGSGQGFLRCLCTKKCVTKRCLCFKNRILCNSKCHSSSPCCNG